MTPAAVAEFVGELRSDPVLAVHADEVADALKALDVEADHNGEALEMYGAAEWIIAQPRRTVEERLFALLKLFALQGKVVINMHELTGW